MAAVKVTFLVDYNGFQANEGAAFDSARAIELVGQRVAAFSDNGDSITYSARVLDYRATNDKPVGVQATIDADRSIHFVGSDEAGRAAIKKYGIN